MASEQVRRRRIHTGGRSSLSALFGVVGSVCNLCCIQSCFCGLHGGSFYSKPVFAQCVGTLFTRPQGVGHVGSPLAGTLKGSMPACTVVGVVHVREDRGTDSVACSDFDLLLIHDPHLLKLSVM